MLKIGKINVMLKTSPIETIKDNERNNIKEFFSVFEKKLNDDFTCFMNEDMFALKIL